MTYRDSGAYYDERKEVVEAINAANDALYHLDQADQLLDKAKNWGIVDILGGGMLISMIKRNRMQDANREIEASRRALNKLNAELRDIRGYRGMDLGNDGLMLMADVWFDNFAMDIFTQSKISKASDSVKHAIAEVEGLLDGLEEQLARQ